MFQYYDIVFLRTGNLVGHGIIALFTLTQIAKNGRECILVV